MGRQPNCKGLQQQSLVKNRRKCSSGKRTAKKAEKMESKTSTSFVVDVAGEKDWKSGDESLQSAFLTYRKKRHDKMVAAGKATRRKRLRRCDPKRMMALRMKFVEQCKKYIGTPYKRKYHEPGTPEYDSPLFLDCCALVRRVVRDLREDFGFELGPWNQTYMYDTLPNVLAREGNLKPGDLVFISGVYFNQKMKPQLHGIVHVEVWLGDGRKTIGARWHKGAVQVFDSYRFKSTSYHSMRYHFKSINPWLMGVCKSHCPIHAWRLPGDFRPSKRSVLHVQTNQQQQQQNASDDDRSQTSSSPREQMATQAQASITDDAGAENRDNDGEDRPALLSASSGSSEDSQESLLKDILLSGSDMIDMLSEKLHISPRRQCPPPSPTSNGKKSLAFIQVTKSIGLTPNQSQCLVVENGGCAVTPQTDSPQGVSIESGRSGE